MGMVMYLFLLEFISWGMLALLYLDQLMCMFFTSGEGVSGPGCDLRVQPTGRLHTMTSHAPRASIYGFLARIRFYHGTPALASSLQARSTELTYSRYHTICSLIRLVFITIYLLPTT